MSGTVGLAAALGLALSNVFWDGCFAVIVVFGVCCVLVLIAGTAVAWDAHRNRRRTREGAVDSMIPVVTERRPLPGPAVLAELAGKRRRDDDTFLADGLRDELDRILREERRG